ncbi:hypothetical protein ACH4VX_13330 [Streptomyces sp. NPDC020731]|uniref:hypothetical protein n=1 Tax=Streptomyces sp. NPDC020731 TaxID=3365085 RepID=UPI00379DF0D0
MDGAAILFILAIAGVASISLFALKGLLDQVPDVIDSASRARDAWERFRKKHNETIEAEEPPPPVTVPADDEEPPAAA